MQACSTWDISHYKLDDAIISASIGTLLNLCHMSSYLVPRIILQWNKAIIILMSFSKDKTETLRVSITYSGILTEC